LTAEVAILNKSAVALAADSAVTVRSVAEGSPGAGISKIYANANKLFELVRGTPVGIMIYDSADLLQVPWETIVKVYRANRHGVVKGSLQEYAEDFTEYIAKNLDRLVPPSARDQHVQFVVSIFAHQVLETCHSKLADMATQGGVKITNAIRRNTLEDVLEDLVKVWDAEDVKPWAVGLDLADLVARYGAQAIDVVPTHLDGWKLNASHRRKLRDLALEAILKLRTSPVETGLVIAGFGEDEIFPSITHIDVGGVVAERLVITTNHTESVTIDQPVRIQPFAQQTEAATFLLGIDPAVKEAIEVFWGEWLSGLGDVARQLIERELPDAPADQVGKVRKRLDEYSSESWTQFAKYMNSLHMNYRYGPMESSAAFLSRGELAALAENLVDLASLRNRVAIDREETVGGAIDVAVISKGDGFVWIKRKHYFGAELNPVWASRQMASALQLDRPREGS
jgi:hypothetical protein